MTSEWILPNTPCWARTSHQDETFARAIILHVHSDQVELQFEGNESSLPILRPTDEIIQIHDYEPMKQSNNQNEDKKLSNLPTLRSDPGIIHDYEPMFKSNTVDDENEILNNRQTTIFSQDMNSKKRSTKVIYQVGFTLPNVEQFSDNDNGSFNDLSNSDQEVEFFFDNKEKTRNLTVQCNVMPAIVYGDGELNKFIQPPNLFDTCDTQNEEISLSNDFQTSLDKLDKGFVKTINETGFLDICQQRIRKFKSLFSDLSVEKVLTYSRMPLSRKKSLITLSSITQQMVPKFQQCLQFLYVRTVPDQATKWIQQFIQILHQSNQELTDEFYLQTLKQIRLCPFADLQLYYSQAVLNLASSLAPSQHWFFAIMNYLYIGARAYEPTENLQYGVRNKLEINILSREVAENLRMSFFRLMRTFGNPRRRYAPTQKEVILTSQHKQLPIAVVIYMQNAQYIDIEPHFQAQKAVQLLCRQLKIPNLADRLGLSLCMPEGQQNIIDESSLIIDIVQDIEIKNDQMKTCNKEQKAFLALRIVEFFVFEQIDINAINIYFAHFSNEFLRGKYILKREQLLELAALKGVVEFGSMKNNNDKCPYLNPIDYVPSQLLANDDEWDNAISIKYKQLVMNKKQAKIRFLEILKQQDLFLTWHWPCELMSAKEVTHQQAIVALKPYRLLISIVENHNSTIIKNYCLLQVLHFTQFGNMVQLRTDDSNSYLFRLKHVLDAKGVESMLRVYTDRAFNWDKDL